MPSSTLEHCWKSSTALVPWTRDRNPLLVIWRKQVAQSGPDRSAPRATILETRYPAVPGGIHRRNAKIDTSTGRDKDQIACTFWKDFGRGTCSVPVRHTHERDVRYTSARETKIGQGLLGPEVPGPMRITSCRMARFF
jgi:hypothetical protein